MTELPPPPPPNASDEAQQYTHSGNRYLLGYGDGFIGIWERARPSGPVERFPRTDAGWLAARRRFVSLEPASTEVGLGLPVATPTAAVAAAPTSTVRAPVAAGRPTHPAWWLLPILMGWMGGLLAWLLIRDQDPARARAMIVAGVLSTLAWIVVYSLVAPMPGAG
jgi:hypothetical protein